MAEAVSEASAAKETATSAESVLEAERAAVRLWSERAEAAEALVKELEEKQEASDGAERDAAWALRESQVGTYLSRRLVFLWKWHGSAAEEIGISHPKRSQRKDCANWVHLNIWCPLSF